VSMAHTSTALPPLDALRAFEAAARTGSFSAAADQLNVTHGAISRQVAKLEQWMGLKLFDRVARGVALTIEGNRLFIRTREAFALIADNTDRWTEPRGGAVVRLASIPSSAACG
jgi:LysR family transcriptional regulator, glycine cleavage system transcriptional activator